MLDARRGEVFAALYSVHRRATVGAPGRHSAGHWPQRLDELPVPPRWPPGRGRYDFGMSWRVGTSKFPTTPISVHRVAARHVCALAEAAADRGDDGLEPDLPEDRPTRSDGVSETLPRRAE